MQETEVFYPENQDAWRRWLEEHHLSKQSVWVVFYRKASGRPSVSWSDAVDTALCFGWIDSKKIKIDSERSHQFFSSRKAGSTWSKINKEKIRKLTESGLMAPAGLSVVEIAKQNGSWTMLDAVEELEIPEDLENAFGMHPGTKAYFQSLSKSVRKMMLQWLVLAKRPETRENRVAEIVECSGRKVIPKAFAGNRNS